MRSWGGSGEERAGGVLAGFRGELYRCFARRQDALFEACDAVLCRPERVHMLAELSLEPECRRGHGALYDAVSRPLTPTAALTADNPGPSGRPAGCRSSRGADRAVGR
jgi:hypothetical protein